MSQRRKKKQSVSQKIIDSQRRNEFLIHLKDYFNKITGDDEIFKLLPKLELDRIYSKRFRPIKVKAGEKQNVSKGILHYCQDQIKQEFKECFIPFKVGAIEQISYHDYFSIAYTLSTYQRILKENQFLGAVQVKKALAEFANKMNSEINFLAWEKYSWIKEVLSILFSDIFLGMCAIDNVKIVETNYIGFCLEIYDVPTDKKYFTIDGEKRIASKLGWLKWDQSIKKNVYSIDYLKIKAEKVDSAMNGDLEIFVQNHALIRLGERMDDMNQGFLHHNTYNSLKNPRVSRNSNGNLLLEFRLFEVKTGYFIAEIIEGALLLKSFLFLTNNGTPEGENLRRNTGLMREDKKYLNIDKISAFINSDIISNEKLKQIFIDAGCESLFKVDTAMYLGEVDKQKKLADMVSRHLKLDD